MGWAGFRPWEVANLLLLVTLEKFNFAHGPTKRRHRDALLHGSSGATLSSRPRRVPIDPRANHTGPLSIDSHDFRRRRASDRDRFLTSHASTPPPPDQVDICPRQPNPAAQPAMNARYRKA